MNNKEVSVMERTGRPRLKLSRIILTALLAVFTLTMLFPLLWMISASFKYEADVFQFPIQWIPENPNFGNYATVWFGKYDFPLYYWNTIKLSVIVTVLQLIISAMGAFAFAKIRFTFREPLFALFLATMMIPDQVTIVPKFMLMKELHLLNTHAGIVLMMVFSVYGVFLLRQNMISIPDALIEAAKIDGAGYGRIFWQIMLPMCTPALITLGILRFIWTWNDYQTALIFLSDQKLYTLQLGMSQFASESGAFYSQMMAAAVCAIVPLLILFVIGQKNIMEGIASGAVKG